MIRTEDRGRVRVLVLDRAAKRNALDRGMTEGIIAGLRAAGEDPAVAAVVIRAEGVGFSAGGDLEEMRPMSKVPTMPPIPMRNKVRLVVEAGRPR